MAIFALTLWGLHYFAANLTLLTLTNSLASISFGFYAIALKLMSFFPHRVGTLARTRDAENAPPIVGVKPEMCCDIDIFR